MSEQNKKEETRSSTAYALNKLFGYNDEFHNVHATAAETDGTPRVTVISPEISPKKQQNAFHMASDHSRHRQVNPTDAMLPQDQSMQPAYQWAGKNMESVLGNKTLTHPDMSALPLYRETGKQYQRTWGEQISPDKTLAPYTDQSSIPLAQAALRNPQNTIHENHARETGFDQGIEKGAPTSLGADFLRGGWDNLLSTGQTLNNAGITGADILLEFSGGDKTANDQARQAKNLLAEIIKENQEEMRKSREQLGTPGSEAYRANELTRKSAQEGGRKAVEIPKQFLTQGAAFLPELISNTSDLYHAHEEWTGEKKIGESLKQGSTATAVYGQTYSAIYKQLDKFPIPGFGKALMADHVAGKARDKFIEQEMRSKKDSKVKY